VWLQLPLYVGVARGKFKQQIAA